MSIIVFIKDISQREKNNRLKLINEYYRIHPCKFFITSSIWHTIDHRVCISGYKNVWIKTIMGFKKLK
jgi:hypothetical protein